jgi:CopA family copper-resistance protein
MNGNAPATNWTGLFKRGERIRLRFINGSAMTYFDVRIPGLQMTVVAADGQYVHPITVDEFRIATAETLDVIVTPDAEEPYTVFAQALDRTGYARGTLAPRAGMQAAVPPLDRRPLLTMAGMDQGSMAGMDHASMPGMDHSAMGPGSSMVEHPASERGNPAVDMQTMSPTPRLDDPGIGLRDEQLQKLRAGYVSGHSVLALSDLRSLFDDPDGRDPGRTVELHLTGHMERYIFSFDGVKFSDAKPLEFKYGERLRVVLVNDTMMEHPVHLHGMWSDVEDEDQAFQVRKHTLTIPPGTKRSYRVTADALGRWAYHCHLLYHMEAGMLREVRVS